MKSYSSIASRTGDQPGRQAVGRRLVQHWLRAILASMLLVSGLEMALVGQEVAGDPSSPIKERVVTRPLSTFKWVDPASDFLMKQLPQTLEHGTFKSQTMDAEVGYYIYLPPEYLAQENSEKRYPVVYYLHGGRPGSESKAIRLANQIESIAKENQLDPVLYVFVNGGPVSHYNLPDHPDAQGADVFIKELIPHIDATYRTIAKREGRGLEGFSQGGRGTARLMFRHPELFCSASPGGGGYATERRISENGGSENPKLKFADGDNTWDLAKVYAEKRKKDGATQKLNILVHVGRDGINYESNLEWMKHLKSLGIEHERLIVPQVGHNARDIYEKQGLQIMKFHVDNFSSGALR